VPEETGRDGLQSAAAKAAATTLVSRNVTVDGKRTSLRLEPLMWDALAEIAQRENRHVNELVTLVEQRRTASSLTAAVRVFVVRYFRAAATEDGHAGAGHGTLGAGGRRGR
jgi:predicted DNA-binding ribbon-helix-helix protein